MHLTTGVVTITTAAIASITISYYLGVSENRP